MIHDDELGAHVSTAGGVPNAPGRAAAIESRNLQLFTKQPNRWAEPVIPADVVAAFRDAREADGIRVTGAHDSYLINLASPDSVLWNQSYRSFVAELKRGRALGLDFLVTHPGNATDGDRASGLARNAEAVDMALEEVDESPRVLLEITAGAGNALGCSFATDSLTKPSMYGLSIFEADSTRVRYEASSTERFIFWMLCTSTGIVGASVIVSRHADFNSPAGHTQFRRKAWDLIGLRPPKIRRLRGSRVGRVPQARGYGNR